MFIATGGRFLAMRQDVPLVAFLYRMIVSIVFCTTSPLMFNAAPRLLWLVLVVVFAPLAILASAHQAMRWKVRVAWAYE